jgi:hypothetical protein
MNRRRATTVALAAALVAIVVGPASVVRAGQTVPRLPDLAMLPPFDFRIEISPEGRRLLRFSTVAVNIGRGPFQIYGYDANGAVIGDILSVRQQIKRSDGTFSERSTTARMSWSGDGHDHWHVIDYQRFRLQNLNARVLGSVAKTGFCAFDSYRYGSTRLAFYTSARPICAVGANGTVLMGHSRNWGDIYRSTIAFQWVDITGLPNSDYKLKVIVDPPFSTGGRFRESNDANNRSWTKIHIGRSTVTVLSKSANP